MEPQESRINVTAALEHLDWVRGLARSLVRDASLADDVTQEAWLAALRRPAAEGVVSRGWLARVVRNAVRQENRRAAIRSVHEERAARFDESASTDELVDRVHVQRMVVDAVLALDTPYQRVILLRYFEGLAPREIARHQGIPVATVKTRLRRALEQLREALDKRHGGDRATWMPAVAALAAPVGSGAGAGTLLIGGMAMGTTTKVSAAVLVAAACVYFATRTPPAEAPRMAAVEPPTADGELEPLGAAVLDPTEVERRSPVADESSGGVAKVAGTNVLRVVLAGISEEDARMATITLTGVDEHGEWPAQIRDSWPSQGLMSELDLDPLLARVAERHEDLRSDAFDVEVDHPLHLRERTRVPLSRGVELESGQTVHEVRVRLDPAAVIHGRLARADGTPAAEGLVGALLLEDDFPVDAEGRAVECAADGAFELRVPASGRYAVASFEAGLRPTTTRVEALVGTRVDVGTVQLEPGHAIAGHALRRGLPLAGATLSATPPTWKTAAAPEDVDAGMKASVYEGRTFTSPARSMHLLWLPPSFSSGATATGLGSRRDGHFELAGQRVSADENGAFAFVGLGSGEYLLRMRELAEAQNSVPGSWDDVGGEDLYRIHGDRPALVVRAPKDGVVLEFRWTSIRFELAGDLESEDQGRLLLKTRSAHPTPVDETGKDLRLVADPMAKNLNFTPEFMTTGFPLSGSEPTFVLQAPPEKRITGEVAFPGLQPVPFDFWTPELGGEIVVPVQLVRSEEEAATLVIELENPQAELPETFTVRSWRADQNDAPPDTRQVEALQGRMRIGGLRPGTYRVRVRPGEDRYFASGLFFENELGVELRPGLAVTRSIRLREGAGMRVTVRGEDGKLVSGQYELFDDAGLPANLVLGTDTTLATEASISSWSFAAYPIHTSLDPIEPGRYRLVLRSPGYAERSVTLDLRAGEYEAVDVTLSR